MVDIASSHAIFSFMDGSSGYNQIKMAPEDERNTAFRTPIGIFCYKAYIRRFISNLSGRCQPFSVLAKKDTKFVWGEKCQNAFDDIKQYLLTRQSWQLRFRKAINPLHRALMSL
ncbi:hypothetical protein MA16_Dca027771 [Dendrobium catenatum]|uniref:Mitochondrial protein n=1 Tax=Dendrobium catenatum TaxID=906689 RepID=A0A2I0VFT3_9ASPA|nr:hypothetical protein MA16_Dca027771 [Dendrobium catenatum]